MIRILMIVILMGTTSTVYSATCEENALEAAIQAEAMQPDAKGFGSPIGAKKVSDQDGVQVWEATVDGNDGQPVTYTVTLDPECNVLEEPQRGR